MTSNPHLHTPVTNLRNPNFVKVSYLFKCMSWTCFSEVLLHCSCWKILNARTRRKWLKDWPSIKNLMRTFFCFYYYYYNAKPFFQIGVGKHHRGFPGQRLLPGLSRPLRHAPGDCVSRLIFSHTGKNITNKIIILGPCRLTLFQKPHKKETMGARIDY